MYRAFGDYWRGEVIMAGEAGRFNPGFLSRTGLRYQQGSLDLGKVERLTIKDSNSYDRRPSREGTSPHRILTHKGSFNVDPILLNSPLASPREG